MTATPLDSRVAEWSILSRIERSYTATENHFCYNQSMVRVYLETSFFSACVSDRTDAKSQVRRTESRHWCLNQRHLHELVVCGEVIREFSAPTYPLRDEALTREATRLDIDEEGRGLARVLVREKVTPGPAETGDAVHVAVATVHRADYMLTWNVRHLANAKKLVHLREVCRRVGYVPPEILTPEALWEIPEEE